MPRILSSIRFFFHRHSQAQVRCHLIVQIGFATNDAWSSTLCDSTCAAAFYGTVEQAVQAVLAAGKIPVIPTIPWSSVAQIQMNAPILNQQIRNIYAAYPGVIPGPDLWTLLTGHSELLMDGVHPNDEGDIAFRNFWSQAMLASHLYR